MKYGRNSGNKKRWPQNRAGKAKAKKDKRKIMQTQYKMQIGMNTQSKNGKRRYLKQEWHEGVATRHMTSDTSMGHEGMWGVEGGTSAKGPMWGLNDKYIQISMIAERENGVEMAEKAKG